MPAKSININGETFELASDEARILTEFLDQFSKKLGNPTDVSTTSGWKVFDAIMTIWYAFYPEEVIEWRESLKEELSVERTPHDAQKKQGGYFPIAYPERLFSLIKILLPDQKLNDMKFIRKLVKLYPILKHTKYSI